MSALFFPFFFLAKHIKSNRKEEIYDKRTIWSEFFNV